MLVGIKITTTLQKKATEHNTTKITKKKHNNTRLTVLVENSMRRVFSSLMSGQTRHRSPGTLSHNDYHDRISDRKHSCWSLTIPWDCWFNSFEVCSSLGLQSRVKDLRIVFSWKKYLLQNICICTGSQLSGPHSCSSILSAAVKGGWAKKYKNYIYYISHTMIIIIIYTI